MLMIVYSKSIEWKNSIWACCGHISSSIRLLVWGFHWFAYVSIFVSMCLSICLFTYLYACLSVYLSCCDTFRTHQASNLFSVRFYLLNLEWWLQSQKDFPLSESQLNLLTEFSKIAEIFVFFWARATISHKY